MNCAALSLGYGSRQQLSSRPCRRTQRLQLRQQQGVLAAATPGQKSEQAEQTPSMLEDLERKAGMMLQRYDFLSAGLGALAVTTFCVARGQDPITAMWITGASTVVALLLNEFLFEDSK